MLARLRAARARAREVAWAQHAETRGDLPQPTVAGRTVAGLVLDIDATIVICHSEKEAATRDLEEDVRLPPAAVLPGQHRRSPGRAAAGRPGRIEHHRRPHHRPRPGPRPDPRRRTGTAPRSCSASDSAGCQPRLPRPHPQPCASSSLRHPLLRRRRDHRSRPGGDPRRDRLGPRRRHRRRPARRRRGLRDHRPVRRRPAGPPGTRLLVRRERPHPGAQLTLFDTIEGWRHQVVATDTPPGGGSIQFLEARHRAHARVEDRIRTGKDTGFGRFPSRIFAINQAWLATRPDRHRPARLDPEPAPGRRTGRRRTEEAALPAAARRRPDHPHRPADPPRHRRQLALDRRPDQRVQPAHRTTPAHRLTPRRTPRPAPRRNPAQRRALACQQNISKHANCTHRAAAIDPCSSERPRLGLAGAA